MSERAQLIRSKRRRVVELEGLEFELVIPSVSDMVAAGLDPIVANVTVDDATRQAKIDKQMEEMQSDITKFLPMATHLLDACMVDPKLHTGDGPCPDDAVTIKDLGNLVYPLATSLLNMLAEDVGEAGTVMARFRVDNDGEDGVGSGADVRDEPIVDLGDGAP